MNNTNTGNPDMFKEFTDKLFEAYEYFNAEMFSNMLPICSITFGQVKSRKQNSTVRGIYEPSVFATNDGDETIIISNITINMPAINTSEKEILATLAHEMVHLWENEYGRPGKNGYHNRYWGESMKKIGLQPSSTGKPGGKEVGKQVSHYVIPNGLFDQVSTKFIEETGFSIDFEYLSSSQPKKESPKKYTYRCACKAPWYSSIRGRSAVCNNCGEEFKLDD